MPQIAVNCSSGRELRLRRLYHHGPALLLTPLDHALAMGPIAPRGCTLDGLVGQLQHGGSDAVVLHKGALRQVRPERFADLSLIVHLNASTPYASDPDEKYLVASVSEALSLGADAVSLHVNLGSRHEQQQIRDLSSVAEACQRWGMPLLAMVYPRGPKINDPRDPELVRHAVTLAAELGADLVKTVQVQDPVAMRQITDASALPVLVAGGPPRRTDSELLHDIRVAMDSGVGGVALGRCLFQAPDPACLTRRVASLVHRPAQLVHTPTMEDCDDGRTQTLLA